MTRIRLGWESQLDQITILIDIVAFGVGLIVLGAISGWSGWITVPMIVLGVLLLLFVLLRVQGGTSLRWRRDLVVDDKRIVLETRSKGAFRIPWRKLAAVGLYSENSTKSQILLLWHKDEEKLERVRIPRRRELATALDAHAPGDWSRPRPGAWDVLLTAPGEAQPPDPDPRRPAIVNIGKRSRLQGLGGGLLIVAIAVGDFSIVWSAHDLGTRLIGLFFGVPFGLAALFALVSMPMAARKRRFVVDGHGFALEDPDADSFVFPWEQITWLGVNIATRDANFVGTATPSLELDTVMIQLRDKTRVVHIGSQAKSVRELAAGVEEFAPDRWAGVNTRRAGRFEIR